MLNDDESSSSHACNDVEAKLKPSKPQCTDPLLSKNRSIQHGHVVGGPRHILNLSDDELFL
jgi:hypothetical protein